MSEGQGRIVVVGGSAGALDALLQMGPLLPADFPLPILVVVHLPPAGKSMLAEVVQNRCDLKVREAEDKETMEGGRVYFAPPDYHLLVESGGYLSLSCDEPNLFSRPSIDVLFESAADAYGENTIGIILSGANNDGSQGLQAVASQGGIVLVQAPETAYARAMPLAALEGCPGARSLSVVEIAKFLRKECGYE